MKEIRVPGDKAQIIAPARCMGMASGSPFVIPKGTHILTIKNAVRVEVPDEVEVYAAPGDAFFFDADETSQAIDLLNTQYSTLGVNLTTQHNTVMSKLMDIEDSIGVGLAGVDTRITGVESYVQTVYAELEDRMDGLDGGQLDAGAIADGAIIETKLADDAVTAAKIATDAVTADAIAAGAVGNTEIADSSVTSAKIAIGAVSSDKIQGGAVTSDKLAANVMTAIRDFIYPVGCFYVQYPDAESNDDATAFPASKRPATLFGGTWVEKWATEAVFFRTRGGPVDSETDNRTNGLQTDQIQNITGTISVSGAKLTGESIASGAFTLDNGGLHYNQATQTSGSNPRFTMDASNVARAGNETRPRNRLIKVWKRTA